MLFDHRFNQRTALTPCCLIIVSIKQHEVSAVLDNMPPPKARLLHQCFFAIHEMSFRVDSRSQNENATKMITHEDAKYYTQAMHLFRQAMALTDTWVPNLHASEDSCLHPTCIFHMYTLHKTLLGGHACTHFTLSPRLQNSF